MKTFISILKTFLKEEKGQSTVEMVMLTGGFAVMSVILYELFMKYIGGIARNSKNIQFILPASL